MADPGKDVPVVAAVLRREGRVLLCRRPEHKRHGGLWEFPGGKLLPGETLGEAARRELAEELRVELTTLTAHLGIRRDPGSPFVIHFVEVTAEGEPSPLEHDELAWALPGDLDRFQLAPGDRAFVTSWLGARRD
jgi:mutator protein MutT